MKSKRMNMVVSIALLVALTITWTITTTPALGATAQRSDSQENNDSRAKKLEGTWRVHVTLRDCQSGVALRTFPAMLSFAQGGTLTETTTAFPPAVRSPGHGFWRHTGGRMYVAQSEAFLFSPAGVWTGTQRLTQLIEVNNDQLTSSATNEIFDTNGNLVVQGCATAVASRME